MENMAKVTGTFSELHHIPSLQTQGHRAQVGPCRVIGGCSNFTNAFTLASGCAKLHVFNAGITALR